MVLAFPHAFVISIAFWLGVTALPCWRQQLHCGWNVQIGKHLWNGQQNATMIDNEHALRHGMPPTHTHTKKNNNWIETIAHTFNLQCQMQTGTHHPTPTKQKTLNNCTTLQNQQTNKQPQHPHKLTHKKHDATFQHLKMHKGSHLKWQTCCNMLSDQDTQHQTIIMSEASFKIWHRTHAWTTML